jgi:pyruvate dehydrogenase E1 component beta subunit
MTMRHLKFSDAIDDALAQAMAADPRIIVLGEDVQMMRASLLLRFGQARIRATPISEAAFAGMGVAAAMAGLRPVVEIMLIDFVGVALDALLNHAAKLAAFSGGRWQTPIVFRAACGGGYGDGGQHEQTLWGWLAHIPGLTLVAPSTPADAGGLMLAALQHEAPVIFFEHKLLSEPLLEFLGTGGRKTVKFDVPRDGAKGPAPHVWEPIPIGTAAIRREGRDVTMISLGVGVHRALQAAQALEQRGVSCGVIDLRTVAPLDRETICHEAARTGRLLVIDEDYEGFGLSGELAALTLEAGIPIKFARVCTRDTIPYARRLEDQTLPNVPCIVETALKLARK